MRTRIAMPKWGITDSFELKLAQVTKAIAEEKNAGQKIVVVGVSAGAALGLLAFCRDRGVDAFISVAGFTKLIDSDRGNSQLMDLTWYRAAGRAELEVGELDKERRAHILSLFGQSDNVIEPERQLIDGATNMQMKAFGHLLSIVVGLIFYRRTIKRFVASRDSE
jgi:dienelactone hydrolase